MANTPRETEPGAITPPGVQDLRNTSDVRLIMIEVAKLGERVNFLIEENKAHKSDFRWTWTGLIAGFLILAGLFMYGYNRLDDRVMDITKIINKADTKLEDLLSRIPPAVTPTPSKHP